MPVAANAAVSPYAPVLTGGAYLEAPSIAAYSVGRGDFTVQAWVKAASAGGSGTVIARKGKDGGTGKGGFLLVVRPDGRVKLATDSGTGYWEIVTNPTAVNDGAWHHLAAVRQNDAFAVYVDGLAVAGTTNGNQRGPLDVSNSQPLTIGTTHQENEPYRAFAGQLGVVRMWRSARGPAEIVADMRSAAATDPSVIGCWTFDAQDGADSSANRNTAAPRGTVTYAAPGAPLAGADVAARLGSSGVFTAPSNAAYQLGTGPFTVEAWVRASGPGAAGTIVARKADAGGSGGFLLVVLPNGQIKFATDHGFGYFEGITELTKVNDGRWHHVAATRDGRPIQVYVDGLPVTTNLGGSATPPLNVDNARPLLIGTTEQSGEKFKHFDGDLAAVTLWRGARTPAQIVADMHALLAGDEAGLIGYWSFGYRNGVDCSPTRNPAAPSGSVAWTAPGAPIGWFAAALAPDGWLQAPSNAAYQLGTRDFTVEAWVKTARAGASGTLVARKNRDGGSGKGGFLLVLRPTGAIKLATDDGFGYFEAVSGTTAVNDGRWHFVAAVRQSREIRLYLDGEALVASTGQNRPPPLNVDSADPLTLGTTLDTYEPHRFLDGQLDAVTLWSGARSAAQIAADMGVRPTGREAGLIGCWDFDFRDGRDSSPVANTAAPNGNVTFPPPGAPIGDVVVIAPTLTSVTYDGRVRLEAEWTTVPQPPRVTGYRLTAFDAAGNALASADTTATRGGLDVPVASAPATVRVRALGDAQPGPWSPPAGIVIGTPSMLALDTDAVIGASWGAASGAGAYRLELDDGDRVVESKVVSAAAGDLAIPADRSRAYTVRVRGLAAADGVSAGPWCTAVPVVLQVVTPTAVGYDGEAVLVTWEPALRFHAVVFDGTIPIASVTGTGTQARMPVTLQPDRRYTVRVRVAGDRTEGPWSAGLPVLPVAPGGRLAGTREGLVAATWNLLEGVPGYEAELAVGGEWGTAQPVPLPPVSFPGPISAGVDYVVRVRAVDGISRGPWGTVPGPFVRAGTLTYDGLGRLHRSDMPAVARTTYAYDPAGNVTSVEVVAPPFPPNGPEPQPEPAAEPEGEPV